MGNDSRQQRDARRRAMGRRVGPREQGRRAGELTRDDVARLVDVAARFATAAPKALAPRIAQLDELAATASRPDVDPAALVVDEVLVRLGPAYENGWQPLDLVHVVRRQATKSAAAWAARAVLVEAGRSRAADRAPVAWSDQLDSLAERHGRVDAAALLVPGGAGSVGRWTDALAVLNLLRVLPRSTLLGPPPSRWDAARSATGRSGRSATRVGARTTEQRAKMLTKVRSLLAKAESTEFAAEAEAFTAKAQDLMARHSIDEALLADGAGESFDVGGVRVLIDQPYTHEKASLLHVVAEANRVRAVFDPFAACATLVGVSTDIEQVDLLFTSTLVQATRAMTQAHLSSAGFRRAFLQAFAIRIGERLTASADDVVASYGSALVPVLQRQGEAVDGEVDRLFPNLTSRRRSRQFDAHGWAAGTSAADAAVLPAGAVEA